MKRNNPASHLKALIELFDREWHQVSFPSFGLWRNRGWDGAGAGFELNYYTRGENTVIQDKLTLNVRQGDLLFVPNNVRHSYCDDGSFDLYYLLFQFDRPELNERMRQLFDQLEFWATSLQMPTLQADFRALITELRMDRQISVMAKQYFLHIFVKIYMDQTESAGYRNKQEQIVKLVIEDIHERLDAGGKILLPDLAVRHSLNERYLNQIFKSVTGSTLGKYILSIRIDGAKRLLETTSVSITEIAILSAFYDGAHFSKAFKQSEKVTPQEYREQHSYVHMHFDQS
ncbi:AraC family transcriptional regulator [Bacillus sp. FJAT-28004]|uniref:AraC family transcriptional regulator n=1 Tax=Bacillus sp. FJAT-28004 TaxID=1679165 RepID=UPI0006B53A5A|nr:AraC family transcriptional regulator [Bacillus sp. FJAT-28004]